MRNTPCTAHNWLGPEGVSVRYSRGMRNLVWGLAGPSGPLLNVTDLMDQPVHLLALLGSAGLTACDLTYGWVSTSLLDVDCLACEEAVSPAATRKL